jgi:hypothetical protein
VCYIPDMKVRAIQFSPALGNVEENLKFHAEKAAVAARDAASYLRDDQPALVLKEMRRILHA